MTQAEIISKLSDLVQSDHCDGCDQNTCDVSVAMRLGYDRWAIEAFAGTGASSQEFDRLYSMLGPEFRRDAESDRKALCEEAHVDCPHCNAVLWLPDECDYHCDSCARDIPRPVSADEEG